MVRFLGFTFLFFLLPFALYAAWRFFKAGVRPGDERWPMIVWLRLGVGGILAMLVSLFVILAYPENEAGGIYRPAHMENGKIVPGRFE
jgi:hypothetical protein